MNRLLRIWLLVGLLCGCTSMGRLEKGATAISSDESVFILGVSPDGYRVAIFPGSIHNGAFEKNQWRNAAFAGHPEDGFVVGKVRTGDTLALTNVNAVKDKESVLGARFGACDGAKTMVFNAPASGGKVLYLGHVHFEMGNGSISAKYHSDRDVAERHIDRRYPELSGRVQNWSYQHLPVEASCTQTIHVPVHAPSR